MKLNRAIVVFAVVIIVGLAVTACLADDLISGGNKWKVYSLTPSGQTLSSKAASSKTGVVLSFSTTPTTNYLLTAPDNPNFTSKTITVTYTVSGSPTFGYDTTNNPCGTPAMARVYFQSAAGGPFNPSNYWWSHSGSAVLAGGNGTLVADTANPNDWSDFYGHMASDTTYTAAFNAAVQNVGSVGLSFGGGCFYANGVGANPGGTTMVLSNFTTN